MSTVETTIDIAAPPKQVWEVLMDAGRLGDWVTIHRKLHGSPDKPLRRGSEIVQTLNLRGVKFKVHWTVVELNEPSLAVWEGHGPARSTAETRYELKPDGENGTRFHYVNEFRPPLGPLGNAASRALVGGVSEREATASLRRLKSLVES
jgi:uncharacterized protein YndB with AHSA1/START domain